MPRINLLTPSVINKIAAGEVIERPASVVKELLENSVDALASRIEIDVVDGGAELIRISDDGEGIHPDDLLLAVTSHATSKLKNADDLFQVQTMGFRGEALASISEVSRFRLRTRQADRPEGYDLEVDGGVMSPPKECGCPIGTTIEVKQIFFNTPVRRKFLKSSATELGHICEQFTRIALANPRLHLVLRHNQKVVYELPATDKLLERLKFFYGPQLADQLIWVESQVNNNRIWGYVAHPSQNKATRKGEYLFLNGRWIQDRSLQHALTEAYRGLLMVGRYPIAFLFLEMPPSEVDVNVHPTKAEVRFQDSQPLYRLLLSAIRNKFLGMNLESTIKVPGQNKDRKPEPIPEPQPELPLQPNSLREELSAWATGQLPGTAMSLPAADSGQSSRFGESQPRIPLGGIPSFKPFPDTVQSFARTTTASVADLRENASGVRESGDAGSARGTPGPPGYSSELPPGGQVSVAGEIDAPDGSSGLDQGIDIADATATKWSSAATAHESDLLHSEFAGAETTFGSASPTTSSVSHLPEITASVPFAHPSHNDGTLRAMQVHDCYLVVESAEGLTVIDQHALHERIMYEYLRERVLSGSVESQRLLLPETVELTPPEACALLEHSETLARIGLEVSDFGGNTVLLSRYPVMLRRLSLSQLVKDIAQQLCDSGLAPSRRDLLDELLHMMSCKAAVKAGQRLSQEEIDSLLAQRHLIDDAHHCPHGRPTSLTLSRVELDRQFGRLGS